MEEGYTILRSAKLANSEYKLYEELARPYHAFTENGRQEFIHGVSKPFKGASTKMPLSSYMSSHIKIGRT